jgi:hypothetical protein
MWLLDAFPADRVAARYGFRPTQEWLDHVRLASARFGGGCSSSFVSPSGLVMTNHHCALDCIQKLSTAKSDLVQDGFYAKQEADERVCPGLELSQLTDVTDVTARVDGATRGLAGAAFRDALRAQLARIEGECRTGTELRCDVVTLYHGGRYHLYRYKRFQDVRLVFAPEVAIAFFGGDPDNFMFPRYDLDVAFVRAYEGGKPAKTPSYFGWSAAGAKPDEPTFVAGHPGSTSRLATVAQLTFLRDVALPESIAMLSEWRGALTELSGRGKEQRRITQKLLFGVENRLKAMKGRRRALVDAEVMAAKVAAEEALRRAASGDPAARAAWDAIADAQRAHRAIYAPYQLLEKGPYGFYATLFDHARALVRAAEERPKPSGERLRELSDAQLPLLERRLLSSAPIEPELESLTLGMGLVRLREVLGPDHPVVKKVLGKEDPRRLADRLVRGSKLIDPAVRKALYDGGRAAVDASKDPMIELARLVDPDARAIRKAYEEQVEAVETKNGELIAKARFAALGTSVYPDATSTLRLSFGAVKGWDEDGRAVAPITTMGGAFERATGNHPFALPKSWLDAQARLDLATPLNLVTSNDIIGGNSGSPVIDREGKIVGLVFDGNIHSLGGDYHYDAAKNRAVALHSEGIVAALDRIYGAKRVVSELGR